MYLTKNKLIGTGIGAFALAAAAGIVGNHVGYDAGFEDGSERVLCMMKKADEKHVAYLKGEISPEEMRAYVMEAC